jgi:hypothetical protein
MFKRNDRLASVSLAVCAGVTAVAGVATGVAVPAGATGGGGTVAAVLVPSYASAAAPKFLTASQLPQGARYGTWKAQPVRAGLPSPRTFCLGGTMAASTTTFTPFRSGTEAGAQHFVAVGLSEARAKGLADRLRTKIEGCFKEWLELTGGTIYKGKKINASWRRYGTYDIADGMTVWGVFTVPPKPTPPTTHLYAVGREGRTVSVLHLGLNGAEKVAPHADFTVTAETALRQLY